MKLAAGYFIALGMLCTGCATVSPPAVPVAGTATDLSQLAGEWSGEYIGDATGRRGVITFMLEAGADTARGDVLMFAKQRSTPPSDDQTHTGSVVVPQNLTIRFVRAANGQVSGQLDPYQDPDCECMVTTTFEGRLKGDVIEGRYNSIRAGQAGPVSGEWKVKRKRS